MPLIEELPVSQSHRITHGWAYVPDTGGPLIAAVQPGNRKRNRDGTVVASANATARQRKAVQARLDSLDKENYKDGVSVPIPARAGADRKRDKKMTANVRRILTYQRGFAHYLADEEALAGTGIVPPVTQQQSSTTTVTTGTATTAAASAAGSGGKGDAKRKSYLNEPVKSARRGRPPASHKDKTMPPPPTTPSSTRSLSKKGKEKAKQDEETVEGVRKDEASHDVEMTDAPAADTTNTTTSTSTEAQKSSSTTTDAVTLVTKTTATSTSATTVAPQQQQNPPPTSQSTPISKPPYDPKLDRHPLLRTTGLPKMPSDRVMAVLVSEPPLSYTAARAKHVSPPSLLQQQPAAPAPVAVATIDENNNSNNNALGVKEKPPRRFCGVCGYWARVKCRRCGEWTCGIMECWKGHEGVCLAAPGAGVF